MCYVQKRNSPVGVWVRCSVGSSGGDLQQQFTGSPPRSSRQHLAALCYSIIPFKYRSRNELMHIDTRIYIQYIQLRSARISFLKYRTCALRSRPVHPRRAIMQRVLLYNSCSPPLAAGTLSNIRSDERTSPLPASRISVP